MNAEKSMTELCRVKKTSLVFRSKPVLKFYKPPRRIRKNPKKAFEINSYFRLSALLFFFALIRIREWNTQNEKKKETLLNVSLSASTNKATDFFFILGRWKEAKKIGKNQMNRWNKAGFRSYSTFVFSPFVLLRIKVYLFYSSVAVPKTEMR